MIALVLPSTLIAQADQTTGVLSGTVKAQTGAPLSGAEVHIVSPSLSRSTTTDSKGFFSFQGLTPDTYTVSISSKGFTDYVASGVNVSAGLATNIRRR